MTLTEERTKPGSPCALNTLADHLKKRMLDLGLTQKNTAQRLGVEATTVASWLTARRAPGLRHFPAVIQFLEYDPRPVPENLGQALVRWRKGRGLSQEELSRLLKVDPKTLGGLEDHRRQPEGRLLNRVVDLVGKFAP